uniref:Uncharacterized protein LOC111100567 isoform X2 n=1 Tax=Crassostrea virginica TaxID=6565 RepID=A0A8B8A9Y6_CRAVI|nr:uncharacterized protein LOC111100567 isoform X2 [Crassostrea virginica]
MNRKPFSSVECLRKCCRKRHSCSPKRIYSDSWMSISEMDIFQLGRIFKANRLATKDLVMHVLFKEVIDYLAMEHLGLPYQLADERGRSTEVSKIEELKKIKKIRKH